MKFSGILAAPIVTVAEMKSRTGTYHTLEGAKKIEKSVAVIDESGRFVARFVKRCIPPEIQKAAEPGLLKASQSGDFKNRASFLGRGIQKHIIKADGSLSERRGVPQSIVEIAGKSGLLGMFDYADPVTRELTCRQTNFTAKKFSTFRDTIPLMHRVDAIFQLVCPEQYERQMIEVMKIHPRYRVGNLCWTTLTVNYNARGAVHVDKGDLRNGVAALTAQSIRDDSFEGGQLILARYGLAFHIEMGDVLYFDPHTEHCNAPLIHGPRLSVVYYVRGRLHECRPEE